MFIGLQFAAPAAPPTAPVVMTARALPAGARLTPADVTVAAVPLDLAPEGALHEISDAAGQILNSPVGSRAMLTQHTLTSTTGLVGPGRVAAPLRIRDSSIAQVVAAGSHVTVLGPGGVVLEDARVAAVPQPSASGGFSLGAAEVFVLLDITPSQAAALTRAESQGTLTVALR